MLWTVGDRAARQGCRIGIGDAISSSPPYTRHVLASSAVLVANRDLNLRPIVRGDAWDAPVTWAHSTDLRDPTPFLSVGQLVLTTGSQFNDAGPDDFRDYVDRLVATGIAGIGFGTELYRDGTPEELVEVCDRTHLSLFEVPYRTPFIAISRAVADAVARESRARDDWARDAQRNISAAALREGGVREAVRAAAAELDRIVLLLGSDGRVTMRSPNRRHSGQVDAESAAHELLRAGRTASRSLDGGSGYVQTLGKPSALRGALAILGDPLDRAARSVVTTLVALAEMSLETANSGSAAIRALRQQCLTLMVDGRWEIVSAVLGQDALPRDDVVVLWLPNRAGLDWEARSMIEDLEVTPRTLVADYDGALVVVTSKPRGIRNARNFAALGLPVGMSAVTPIPEIGTAMDQARLAAESAPPGAVSTFDRATDTVFGLLKRSDVSVRARRRLANMAATPDSAELLRCARAWFDSNCQWEPAARELGMHRHSLQARIDRLGDLLGVRLDEFAGRAELWALLTAGD